MILASLFVNVLVGQHLFARFYPEPGSGCEYGYGIAATPDGGVVFCGLDENPSTSDYDFGVVKLDAQGTLQWKRAYNVSGNSYEDAVAIVVTSDNNYAAVGTTSSSRILLVKINPANGNIIWASTFSGSTSFQASSMAQTTDGGYIIGGYEGFAIYVNPDAAVVIKATSSGGLSWAGKYDQASLSDCFRAVAATSDGGAIVVGHRANGSNSNKDILVMKFSSSGTMEWGRSYGGSAEDWGASVIQVSDGYVILGHTKSFADATYGELLLMKLDNSGNPIWAKTYNGTYTDHPYALIQAPDGGFVISCYTSSGGFSFMKTSSDGTFLWGKGSGVYGADYSVDEHESIARTADGGYAMVAFRFVGSTAYDYFVMKVGPDGSYPACGISLNPSVANRILSFNSVSAPSAYSPTQTYITPTTRDPNLSTVEQCPPAVEVVDESAPRSTKIICSPMSGGLVFFADHETQLTIYSPDGRLAYSGELKKGGNRIGLETGVYLWVAGQFKGRAIVR